MILVSLITEICFFCLFGCCFDFETESLYSFLTVLKFLMETRLALKSQRFTCPCSWVCAITPSRPVLFISLIKDNEDPFRVSLISLEFLPLCHQTVWSAQKINQLENAVNDLWEWAWVLFWTFQWSRGEHCLEHRAKNTCKEEEPNKWWGLKAPCPVELVTAMS